MGETPGDNSCVVHKKSWKPLPSLVPILNIMGMAWLKMNSYDCCRIMSKMASWQCFKDLNYRHHHWHGTFLGFAFSMPECHAPNATGLTWQGQAMPSNLLRSDKVKVEATQEEVPNRDETVGHVFLSTSRKMDLQKDTQRYSRYSFHSPKSLPRFFLFEVVGGSSKMGIHPLVTSPDNMGCPGTHWFCLNCPGNMWLNSTTSRISRSQLQNTYKNLVHKLSFDRCMVLK